MDAYEEIELQLSETERLIKILKHIGFIEVHGEEKEKLIHNLKMNGMDSETDKTGN